MLELVELDESMESQFMEFRQSLKPEDPNGRWLFEYNGEPFYTLVQKLQDWKAGIQLPKGWVPCSTFYLVDGQMRIVGKSSLRHELNDFLKTIGGHIGYVIGPDRRQKGYGTQILRLTLDKARNLGLKQVLITCDENNIASAKIIEANGGIFENTYREDGMTVAKRRYWVTLEPGADNGNH